MFPLSSSLIDDNGLSLAAMSPGYAIARIWLWFGSLILSNQYAVPSFSYRGKAVIVI